MASAWGRAWGASWGVSWGAIRRAQGAGASSGTKRRRRIVLEIDGRALWFETVEEAQAALERIAEDAPKTAPPPRVRVRVKPAIKRESDAPRVEIAPVPLDVSALVEWVARWREMARLEWERRRQEEARRALEAEIDDEETLLWLL